MFTIDDIREIAIQIEKNGEQAYRRAAAAADQPEIAALFTRMADDEREHAEWFSSIRSNRHLSGDELELEQMGRRLLQEMVANQTFSLDQQELRQVRDVEDSLEQSRIFEEDTALFYEFLHSMIEDVEVKSHLEVIIAEERRHAEQIAELADSDPVGL
ncbi:ferritin family protein [Desulfofustis glycolicus]|uniref:Rubrerythrin n=1 Tax=Desulfofustis glycolicus DSM 9705 TaxID=1121409 RepID=A0A1M5X6Q1_9BACT|nr:ferritin family protein [Desulfofustis glycolicus]MCB2216054.1 ferritin-like domain-containing protein [Desulfobulbaceae bacterium]SHH95174.1 Rubrerythrin [Desulfofustis glycolicus DSM 9705]